MDDVVMPWRKYCGVPLGEVPRSYLRWCLDNLDDMNPWLRGKIEETLNGGPPPGQGTRTDNGGSSYRPPFTGAQPHAGASEAMAARIVEAGYRNLARQLHPDTGGDLASMVELNLTVEWLRMLFRDER